MRKNPAIWISLIAALLALSVSFGVRISGTQSEAILRLAEIAVPLIIGGAGFAIRSQVYNADSAQLALRMPPDSSVKLLDQVIETGVRVEPNDTKAEIVSKINNANVA